MPLNAVFVDCTPELSQVLRTSKWPAPQWIKINEGNPTAGDLVKLCTDAELLLVEHTVVPVEVLDACPHLKGIVFMGTGAGTYIPLDEARRRGLPVATISGYANRAVAEHAMALLFAAARQVSRMDREIRAGDWNPLGGIQLRGRKVAVVGLGGIGEEFASLAKAIGMRVSAWNHSARPHPDFVADLDTALQGADVVSLHLALNSDTAGILDARRLQLLRPGAILVNTARAQLVDESALLAALRVGQVAHASLDVFVEEPLPRASEWVKLTNVTLTSHAAYMTEDAYQQLWQQTVAEAERLRGSH